MAVRIGSIGVIMVMLLPKNRTQLSRTDIWTGHQEQVYWAHANHAWLSRTDWSKWWADTNSGEMGSNLRELFKYDLGQKRDLGATIDALQAKKYSKKFDNLPFALQACLAEWSEDHSGPNLTRAKAKGFAEQWHHILTAPGWEDVRKLPNAHHLLQGSLETMRILGQDKDVNQEHFQKWVHDTMAFAPLEWQELRQAAFSIWQGMEPAEKMKMNRDWAVHYDLCPDELAFLSHARVVPATAVQKLTTGIKTAFTGMFPGP